MENCLLSLAEGYEGEVTLVCISSAHSFERALRGARVYGATTVAVTRPGRQGLTRKEGKEAGLSKKRWKKTAKGARPVLLEAARRGLIWDFTRPPSAQQMAEEEEWADRVGLRLPRQLVWGGVARAWRGGQYFDLVPETF